MMAGPSTNLRLNIYPAKYSTGTDSCAYARRLSCVDGHFHYGSKLTGAGMQKYGVHDCYT